MLPGHIFYSKLVVFRIFKLFLPPEMSVNDDNNNKYYYINICIMNIILVVWSFGVWSTLIKPNTHKKLNIRTYIS